MSAKGERRGAIVDGYYTPARIPIRGLTCTELKWLVLAIGGAGRADWKRGRKSLVRSIANHVELVVLRAISQSSLPTEREVAGELERIEAAARAFLAAIAPGSDDFESAAEFSVRTLREVGPTPGMVDDAAAAVMRLSEECRRRATDLRLSSQRPVKRTTDLDEFLGEIGLLMHCYTGSSALPRNDDPARFVASPYFRVVRQAVVIATRLAWDAADRGVPGAERARDRLAEIADVGDAALLKRIRRSFQKYRETISLLETVALEQRSAP